MATDPVQLSGRQFLPGLSRASSRSGRVATSRRELTVPSLLARCFDAKVDLPPWMLKPGLTLERMAQRRRSLAARLSDLAQMQIEIDDLFIQHLPAHTSWLEPSLTTAYQPTEIVSRWVDTLFAEAAVLLRREVMPDMADQGMFVRPVVTLNELQRAWLHQHFTRHIYPLLTPLAVDPGRPFPFISSGSVNLLVELRRPDARTMGARALLARVKIPTACPRLVALPALPSERPGAIGAGVHVCTADVVRFFVHHLFPGMPVRRVYLFRVVRGESPLLGTVASEKWRPRRNGSRPAVRMDAEQRMDEEVLAWLAEHLRLPAYAVARHDGLAEWACLPQLAETR